MYRLTVPLLVGSWSGLVNILSYCGRSTLGQFGFLLGAGHWWTNSQKMVL